MKPRVIALYLPQYHPTPENDEWWGKGFTEWTNVGKAKPLFKGHEQPKVPADLGYYDLRLPEVREQQANMAKEAGVEGFCYYHYWFGNGKRILERPFEEVVKSGKPDYPFCLCWANESWHSKFWNIDGTIQKKLLVEQLYPGDKDIINHFNTLLPAFKDNRYIKVYGKPFFMIYLPLAFPDVTHFIDVWQKLAKENGFPGIYFVGHLVHGKEITPENIEKIKALGFDAVNVAGLFRGIRHFKSPLYKRVVRKLFKRPEIKKYSQLLPYLIMDSDKKPYVIPTITPNWDHTPSSGSSGTVVVDCKPELFAKNVKDAIKFVADKNDEEKIVILKAWNEWGEGNYMEPDLVHGYEKIDVLKQCLNKSK